MKTPELGPRSEKALVRALERRFGQSTMPYEFQYKFENAYGTHWRVTDTESGSWIEGSFYCGRLTVREHHDAALLAGVEAKYADQRSAV